LRTLRSHEMPECSSGVLAGYVALARTEPAGWWLDPVDLIVYRDAGLIVRQVSPLYNPHLATPPLSGPFTSVRSSSC